VIYHFAFDCDLISVGPTSLTNLTSPICHLCVFKTRLNTIARSQTSSDSCRTFKPESTNVHTSGKVGSQQGGRVPELYSSCKSNARQQRQEE